MRRIAFVLFMLVLMPSAAVWAQIDKPVTPEDLADKRSANAAQHKDELKVIADAEVALRTMLGPDPGDDPKADAPFIQIRIIRCLANGDYSRKSKEIYLEAATAAGQLASELEAKSGAPSAHSGAGAVSEMNKQLAETVQREAELRAKATLNDGERVERDGLEALEKQLRETLSIFEQIQARDDISKSARTATQMREKEALFRFKAREANGHAASYDLECQGLRSVLADIAERERNEQSVARWDKVDAGESGTRPAERGPKGAAYKPISPAESELSRLRDQHKDDDQRWNDLEAVKKQLDHLLQISRPSGTN